MERFRSQHPVDQLIRALIETGREASPAEAGQIIGQIARAPFNPRVIPVPLAERGSTYQEHTLGPREPSLTYHLIKRVIVEAQWADGTTSGEYLADLRQAVQVPTARLVLYASRDEHFAATMTPTADSVPAARQGAGAQPWLLVVYSADRGIIVTGYGISRLDRARIPGNARWLR